jgi:hypothetical protein
VVFSLPKSNQTIDVTSTVPASAQVAGATYTPSASATSGLPVTVTVDSDTICSISGGVVSFIGAGSCQLRFSQAGNATFNAAPDEFQVFDVNKGIPFLTFVSNFDTPVVGGVPYTPIVISTNPNAAIIITVSTSSTPFCVFDGRDVNFIASGNCFLNANQFEDANYLAAPQSSQSRFVAKGSQTLSFTTSPPAAPVVNSGTYTPIGVSSAGLTPVVFTIDASTAGNCAISVGGVVTFISLGQCLINANQIGDDNYNAAAQISQSCGVGLSSQTISVTSTAPVSAYFGGPVYTVSATATSGLAVTMAIDGAASAVCAISGNVVEFIGPGTCSIVFSQSGDGTFNAAVQVQQVFEVGKASQILTFSSTKPQPAIVGGPQYTPAASSNIIGLPVTFSVTPPSVCSIFNGGVIFLGAGNCSVKANQAGTSLYFAQDAYQFIDVEAASTSSTTAAPTAAPLMSQTISYNNGFAAGVVGKNFVFDATASSGLPVAANVVMSSAGICAFEAGNVLNLIAEGSCEILLTQPGDAQFLAASLTVTLNVVKDFCPMQPCNCTVDECSIFSDWNMKPDENVLIPSGVGIVVQQDVVFGAQSVSNVFGGTGKIPFKVMGRATLGGIVREEPIRRWGKCSKNDERASDSCGDHDSCFGRGKSRGKL